MKRVTCKTKNTSKTMCARHLIVGLLVLALWGIGTLAQGAPSVQGDKDDKKDTISTQQVAPHRIAVAHNHHHHHAHPGHHDHHTYHDIATLDHEHASMDKDHSDAHGHQGIHAHHAHLGHHGHHSAHIHDGHHGHHGAHTHDGHLGHPGHHGHLGLHGLHGVHEHHEHGHHLGLHGDHGLHALGHAVHGHHLGLHGHHGLHGLGHAEHGHHLGPHGHHSDSVYGHHDHGHGHHHVHVGHHHQVYPKITTHTHHHHVPIHDYHNDHALHDPEHGHQEHGHGNGHEHGYHQHKPSEWYWFKISNRLPHNMVLNVQCRDDKGLNGRHKDVLNHKFVMNFKMQDQEYWTCLMKFEGTNACKEVKVWEKLHSELDCKFCTWKATTDGIFVKEWSEVNGKDVWVLKHEWEDCGLRRNHGTASD